MSIREIGSTPIVATSLEELVGFAAIESGDSAAEASTELRHLGRELRTQAQQQQVAEQRRAAEQDLIAGVAKGVGQIVAGTCSIAGGAHGLVSAGGAPRTEQLREEFSTRIGHEVGFFRSGGEVLRAGADIGAALAARDAAESRARATEREQAASAAQDIVQQAGEDAEEARSTADKATAALERLLEEKRRASDAASRA
jgi:hypothetical protein